MAFCENCGRYVEDNAKFCGNCGQPIDDHTLPIPDMIQNSEEYFAEMKPKSNVKIIGIILAFVVIAVVAGVVWFLLGNDEENDQELTGQTQKAAVSEVDKVLDEDMETKEEISIVGEKSKEDEIVKEENEGAKKDTDWEEPDYESVSMSNVLSVTATSSLSEYNMTHSPDRVIDGDLSTGWVEEASGQGIGESITIYFDDYYKVNGFLIHAGFQASSDLYDKNSRPEEIKISYSDGSYETYTLVDINDEQEIHLSESVVTDSVTFTILSVYEGYKYEDTVISEIYIY